MKWQIAARTLAVIGLLLGGLSTPRALAQDPTGPKSVDQPDVGAAARAGATAYTDQLIIKYRANAGIEALQAAGAEQMQTLSAAAGVSLTYFREMSGDAHVLKLPEALPEAEVAALAQKLAALPEVEYAEADGRNYIQATPNDSLYTQQWHYFAPITGTYGANLPGAWDIITGSVNIRIAVLDSGILFDHPDLLDRTLPGYDFVSEPIVANDGDGRDANAADPGDWVSNNDRVNHPSLFGNCPVLDSSWHGTHVAGTIGAATNNGTGVAGINWVSSILPVRVLGKCFGYTSDIADGIRWAAGLPVTGIPANPNPARVINMSLGSGGACGTTYQSAIDAAVASGSVIVVSAGNENQNVSGFRPANCNNVITVAATDRNGSKAAYSNFGSLVKISAPGGTGGTGSPDAVLSTLNQGTTTPVPNNAFYQFYNGTSMAAPHVAGVVSLMLSVNPSLVPAQVLSLLQSTATPFPASSTCSATTCGAGLLNAAAAVQAAQGAPILNQRVFLPIINRDFGSSGLVPNGNFEAGATAWTQYSRLGYLIIVNNFGLTGVTARSGSHAAWLGGDHDEESYLQQNITVPAGAPYLSYWHWIRSNETLPDYDVAYVNVNGVTVDSFSTYTVTNTGNWVKRVVDLSAYAGQTVTLQFRHITNSSQHSSWFLDDIDFQSTP
ncbi:MAG: S8 family serine peptidase [Anaerolineales bacterium]|nr:S8 family serine peptidase [Anaerolineales bacterium]